MPIDRRAIIPQDRIPKFCYKCGASIIPKVEDLQKHPFVCSGTPQHIHFISPNPVAVAGLFVRLDDGRLGVCLGRRGLKHEVAYGKWALPGGFTEAETGPEAARDEFIEEMGVDVSDVEFHHADEHYDPNTFCIIHFYMGLWQRAAPPQLRVTKESSEVGIFPVDELPEDLAFPYQAEIVQRAALMI